MALKTLEKPEDFIAFRKAFVASSLDGKPRDNLGAITNPEELDEAMLVAMFGCACADEMREVGDAYTAWNQRLGL